MTIRQSSCASPFSDVLALAPLAHAQSTAINGTIEGVARDATGAVLPGVTIHVANLDTGAQRTVTTGVDGGFRALLLPLGTYTVRAEMQGFKAAERTGVKLSAGQTATLNFTLEVGGVQEVVSVSGEAADRGAGQDRPRPHDQRGGDQEPAPGLAQPVQLRVPAGQRHRVRERGVRRAAHQRQRHPDAHQLPDRRQHQHREGPGRPAPAAGVGGHGQGGQGHHQRLRPRVRPDHGHGLQRGDALRDANQLSGSASFRFRRKDFSEKPFFLAATAPKPDTNVNNWTATLGGPIVKDRTHFYLGYEYVDRDLSADRVITVSPAERGPPRPRQRGHSRSAE